MWDFFQRLFDPEYMPHGHCYLWQPGLLWTNVISDALIFFAYSLIPAAIAIVYYKRPDLLMAKVGLLFMIFITACGITHLIGVWNVWHGAYWLAGIAKAITATVSLITAAALYILLPKILKIPTLAVLSEQVRQRDEAVHELEAERLRLRENVQARTAAIEAKNRELTEEKARLEAFQDLALEREERMMELKREVNDLLQALGRPARFPLSPGDASE